MFALMARARRARQQRCPPRRLVGLAEERGLHVVSAPDTVLGEAIQTARQAIDAGWIGRPFGSVGHALWAGPAGWHPSREHPYRPQAGPVLDSAPHTVAAVVHLLGSVRRLAAFGSRSFPQLTVGSGPKAGRRFDGGTDTSVASVLELDDGIAGTVVQSMSTPHTRLGDPRQKDMGIEIDGPLGALVLPDPAFHDGPVLFRSREADGWSELHVLKVLLRRVDADDSATLQVVESSAARVPAAPVGLAPGRLSHGG